MRHPWYAILLVVTATILTASCGKKSKKSDNPVAETTDTGTTYTFNAVNTAHLAQSFDANTPNGFKTVTALAGLLDSSATTLCHSQYGFGTPEDIACETMADIQARFFSASPTNIHDRLADLDKTLNSALTSLDGAYVPCLDSSRTASTTYAAFYAAGAQNPTAVTFPPYALTTVPLKSTFLNNFSLDTGDALKLSCFNFSSNSDGSKKGAGQAYGFDAATGTWYLYALSDSHIGTFGSVDQANNINLWFSIGDTSAKGDKGQDAAEKASGTAIYGGSTGIVQIISKPSLGLVGLTQVGTGIGPGCGAQLLMNSSTLYFAGNVNSYGQCWDTDFAVATGSTHSSTLDNVQVCMDVSGTTVTPTPDLTACVKSGLITLDDSGKVVSPFAAAGLKYLTANSSSGVAGAVVARAWEGSFFMGETDFSAMPPFGEIRLSGSDTVQVSGYSAFSYALDRTTAAAKQSTSVTASCAATGTALQSALSETFQLTVAKIVAAQQTISPSSSSSPTSMSDMVVAQMNTAFANTDATAATITFPMTGTRGTNFYGSFAGTATVKLDGTAIGTAKLTMPGTSGAMSATGSVTIPVGTQVTADSVFDVTVTGTLTLTCAAAQAVTRTVAAKPAVPTLTWYQQNTPAASSAKGGS